LHDDLVVLGETQATVLLGQVQPAEHLVPHPDRHAEKGPHRRVVGREPDRGGVRRDVRQPQRLAFLDHHAQHATTGGQRPDPLRRRAVDALVDELGERAVLAQHTERAVPRVDQVHRGPHDPPQRLVQLQTRRHREDGLQQPVHPVPGTDDLLDPVLYLRQQLPQAQL
jgi:hypothetical protein